MGNNGCIICEEEVLYAFQLDFGPRSQSRDWEKATPSIENTEMQDSISPLTKATSPIWCILQEELLIGWLIDWIYTVLN